jgi:SOS-response transcriptional repressor LexA
MRPITPRQYTVLEVMYRHLQEYQCVPAMRELGRILGFRSTNAANDFLVALEAKGFIERFARVTRGYRLTAKAFAALGAVCPTCGQSMAGQRAA